MINTRHKIVIDQMKESYYCHEQQHLLAGMTSLNKKGICSGCHGGGCGVCKILILQGEVKIKTMSRQHVSEIEQSMGIYLACRVYPRSDIKLKVIGKLKKNILNPGCNKKYGFV